MKFVSSLIMCKINSVTSFAVLTWHFLLQVISKEFHLGLSDPVSRSSVVSWKDGQDLTKKNGSSKGRKRPHEMGGFFSWFLNNDDPCSDEIAEVIKDDIWPNPLQYYLMELDGGEVNFPLNLFCGTRQ
jgi:template-activating factor I